jgi:hypothetical protein
VGSKVQAFGGTTAQAVSMASAQKLMAIRIGDPG